MFPCAGVAEGLGTLGVTEHIGPSLNLSEAPHLTSIPEPTRVTLWEGLPLQLSRSLTGTRAVTRVTTPARCMDTCTWRKEEKEGGRLGSLLNGTAELGWEGQRVEVQFTERHTGRR